METFDSESKRMWGCLSILVLVAVLFVLCVRVGNLEEYSSDLEGDDTRHLKSREEGDRNTAGKGRRRPS